VVVHEQKEEELTQTQSTLSKSREEENKSTAPSASLRAGGYGCATEYRE